MVFTKNNFGQVAMVSQEALKFGAKCKKDKTAQSKLLSAIFGNDASER